MPLNFPSSGLTANETTYTFSGNTWIWNGYAWDSVVTPASVGIAGYVSAINGITGAVGITAGSNITITQSGLTFTISSSAAGGGPLASASVTGVASFGNEFVVSALGAVSLTANYVKSVNGSTGAIVSVAVTGSNTFAGLQTMNAGITANNLWVTNGATFASRAAFTAGITSNNLWVTSGATFASRASFTAGITASTLYAVGATFVTLNASNIYSTNLSANTQYTDGLLPYTGTVISINNNGNLTTIGDYGFEGDSDFLNNGTYISVNDDTQLIRLKAGNGIDNIGSFLNSVSAPSFTDTYSFCQTYRTTTTATTANQTIATIPEVYDITTSTMIYPAFEVTISARDTVLNKTEMLKMLVVQDGTNTVNTQYGLIRTGATGPVSSYSTTLTGTPKNLLIRATPLSANSTVFTTTVRAQQNG